MEMQELSLAKLEFTPLADWLLIEPIPRGETPGGIALPEGVSDEDPMKGRIVKVGPGRMTEEGVLVEPNVTPGQIVYLYFVYGQPLFISLNGKKYIIARCRDLIGVAEQ